MFTEALDAGKEVRAVFCDFSKGFDHVWHEGLVYKLKAAGVSGDVLRWFQSYLSGRRQCVGLPCTFSEWFTSKPECHKALYLVLFCFYCILNI